MVDARQAHPNRSPRNHLRWIAGTNRIRVKKVDEVLDMVAAVMTIAAVVVGNLTAPPLVGSQRPFADPGTWRLVGAITLYAALTAVLGVGMAALLRHSAGAVAVLLLWPLLVEPVLGNLPSIGSEVGPYLPFANVFRFIDVQWHYPGYAMPWGVLGSLLYFLTVIAVVYAAAIVMVNRRDA